jgi:hypothetical protein
MRTMSKQLNSDFLVTDRSTGRSWIADPQEWLVQGQITRMRTPETHVILAREIAKRLIADGRAGGPLEVRAILLMSLNGGEKFFLFDPNVDLTQGGLRQAARSAVLTQEETWPILPLRIRFARDLERALSGEAWPSERGPFEFERRRPSGEAG